MNTVVRLWLLWQSILASLLLLSVFFGYRAYLQARMARQEISFVRSLNLVWATTWGQTPDVVRSALQACLRRLEEEVPQPNWMLRLFWSVRELIRRRRQEGGGK